MVFHGIAQESVVYGRSIRVGAPLSVLLSSKSLFSAQEFHAAEVSCSTDAFLAA